MAKEMEHVVFHTAMGWVGVSASARGVAGIVLPQRSSEQARRLLGGDIDSDAVQNRPDLDGLVQRLKAYFGGARVDFPDSLDMSGGTPFQRRVWRVARKIPYGETRSYGWVARKTGKARAARAVGQALSSNPLPIIVPCHRVIAGDGGLGGFSDGLALKRRLLRLEAPRIRLPGAAR